MCATLDILTSVTVTGSPQPQPLPWPSIVSSSEIFQFNYLNILHEKHPIETWQPIGKNVWRWHSLLLYDVSLWARMREMNCVLRIWDVSEWEYEMLPATKFLADCRLLAECLLLGARGAVPGAARPRAQPPAAPAPSQCGMSGERG